VPGGKRGKEKTPPLPPSRGLYLHRKRRKKKEEATPFPSLQKEKGEVAPLSDRAVRVFRRGKSFLAREGGGDMFSLDFLPL